MCHKAARKKRAGRCLLWAALSAAVPALWAQTTLDWRHVGGFTVERGLAGPAGGPVEAVWFSGETLIARIAAGRTFQTTDFEHWEPSKAAEPARPAAEIPDASRLPEPGSVLRTVPGDAANLYALGTNVYRSGDSGRSWQSLTGYRNQPVIGGGARDVAMAPGNPQHLAVANQFGVWHSTDGGLSWTSANEGLPNITVDGLLTPAKNSTVPRIALEGGLAAQLAASRERWLLAPEPDPGAADRQRAAEALHTDITAAAGSGDTFVAGSADGRLWFSRDGGASFAESANAVAGVRIERLTVLPEEPRIALAVAGGKVLQSANGGRLWNEMTGNLPEGRLRGVAADKDGGAVYVAGEQGVYWTRVDLNAAVSTATWEPLTAGLPAGRALAVRLANGGGQLFAAVEGYGVYATPAPHRSRAWKLVNAADLSQRAAAPGSLLSLTGGAAAGVRGGQLAFPVLAAASSGSQIQVPFEATGPSLSLDVVSAEARHMTFGFTLKSLSPAIFVDSEGSPVFLDADTGLTLDVANTARPNTRAQVLVTGLGHVQPEWPTGRAAPASDPPAVTAKVQAFLDGTELKVTRATLAPGYVGCYLVEFETPAVVNAGPAEFYLAADGETSNRVSLHLSQ